MKRIFLALTLVCLLGGSARAVTEARWAPHYPDGPRAANHLQIRFTPRTLEIVSGPHKLEGDPKTWRPVVLELKNGK